MCGVKVDFFGLNIKYLVTCNSMEWAGLSSEPALDRRVLGKALRYLYPCESDFALSCCITGAKAECDCYRQQLSSQFYSNQPYTGPSWHWKHNWHHHWYDCEYSPPLAFLFAFLSNLLHRHDTLFHVTSSNALFSFIFQKNNVEQVVSLPVMFLHMLFSCAVGTHFPPNPKGFPSKPTAFTIWNGTSGSTT